MGMTVLTECLLAEALVFQSLGDGALLALQTDEQDSCAVTPIGVPAFANTPMHGMVGAEVIQIHPQVQMMQQLVMVDILECCTEFLV